MLISFPVLLVWLAAQDAPASQPDELTADERAAAQVIANTAFAARQEQIDQLSAELKALQKRPPSKSKGDQIRVVRKQLDAVQKNTVMPLGRAGFAVGSIGVFEETRFCVVRTQLDGSLLVEAKYVVERTVGYTQGTGNFPIKRAVERTADGLFLLRGFGKQAADGQHVAINDPVHVSGTTQMDGMTVTVIERLSDRIESEARRAYADLCRPKPKK